MDPVEDLKQRVAQSCRILGALGLAKGATGHTSARLPGTNRIFVRARGPGELGVRFTTPDQVIEVGLDGKPVEKSDFGLEAPLEVFIHTQVYSARPDVYAVVHVHPLPVVLFTICNKPLQALYGAYDPSSARLAIKGIPTYQRSTLCDSPALGDELVAAMGQSNCCMMKGHGITTADRNVEAASLTAIHLNNLAEVNYQANLLGNPEPIPPDEQAMFVGMEKPNRPPEPGVAPVGRAAALWRYYCSLVDTN